jgi:AmmeMemoRadiSam system protein A/AmmeMemoRadiSam system protein B
MEHFPFVSVFDGEAYETPLGRIEVDSDIATDIASTDDGIELSERGHIQTGSPPKEHALEVQLPFLQCVLEDFRIVPIVMGDQNWNLCASLGAALSPYLAREDFLIVVSTDLSHFHGYDLANRMDGHFCELLGEMNPLGIYESIRSHQCEACGAGPVIASLLAGERAGATDCTILHAANSGDITGDRGSVVGYAAAVISGTETNPSAHIEEEGEEALLTAEERAHLLTTAHHAVEAAVGVASEPPPAMNTPNLLSPRGAFVTLKLNNRLRGCIGMVEARKSLLDTVSEMARASAMNDPRFAPLSEGDLQGLGVEISVLSPVRRIHSVGEIEVGRHGLVVRKGAYHGLLLPQVASEAGWDAETFLEFTCEKAGLDPDAWRDEDTKIFVFTALVFGDEKERTH